MPDKLTDNEIIKALECCKNGTLNDCDDCPCFNDEDTDTARDCAENLMSNALDLINRLQADNEILRKLKAYFDFYYGCDVEILGIDEDGNTTSFDEFYNCAIANTESIEHHIAHIIKTAKGEAYKECIEKVKNELKNIAKIEWQDNYYYLVGTAFFDNLLKELVGEEK